MKKYFEKKNDKVQKREEKTEHDAGKKVLISDQNLVCVAGGRRPEFSR